MRQLIITRSITNREDNYLDKYFKDISKYGQIGPEEEAELARKIRTGDEQALDKLVHSNLRFVVSVAKQYQNQGLSLADLINAGNIGITKAAKKFDETRGFKFISYAVWWIRQSILQSLTDESRPIRLPLNKLTTLSKIKKMSEIFEQTNEREPSPEEIAESLGLSTELIVEVLTASQKIISYDKPMLSSEEDSSPLSDMLSEENHSIIYESFNSDDLKLAIRRAIEDDLLTEDQKYILQYSYGIECTKMSLEDIGEELGLSTTQVNARKNIALKIIKSNNKELKKFLS